MKKPRFKFDNNILLHLALEQLGTTKAQFQSKLFKQLNLLGAKHIAREVIQRNDAHQNCNTWTTDSHILQTTDYGRILRVTRQIRRQPLQQTTPTIQFKKRRRI